MKIIVDIDRHLRTDRGENTKSMRGRQGSKGRSRSKERPGVGEFSIQRPDSVPLQTVRGLCRPENCSGAWQWDEAILPDHVVHVLAAKACIEKKSNQVFFKNISIRNKQAKTHTKKKEKTKRKTAFLSRTQDF